MSRTVIRQCRPVAVRCVTEVKRDARHGDVKRLGSRQRVNIDFCHDYRDRDIHSIQRERWREREIATAGDARSGRYTRSQTEQQTGGWRVGIRR